MEKEEVKQKLQLQEQHQYSQIQQREKTQLDSFNNQYLDNLGIPNHVCDVTIDDNFTFTEEKTRGIDFLRPLAENTYINSAICTDTQEFMYESIDRHFLEPPRLPIDISLFPLEKTHFLTDASPIEVCREFSKAFTDNKVDINKFDDKKYKFKCEFNIEDEENGQIRERLSFRTRIYTVNKEKKYVVELQRRDGCCLEWRKLYNNLKASIPLSHIVV